MYDDSDGHIAIQDLPDLENNSNVQTMSTNRAHDTENFESWINQLEEKSKKQQKVPDEKKFLHPF